jgi:hypothetical protein
MDYADVTIPSTLSMAFKLVDSKMNEQWIKWEPNKKLAKKYEIDSILDNFNGFKIILSDVDDEKKKVQVVFKNSVDSYNYSEEGFRLKTVWRLGDKYGKNFYGDWTFFKITNSKYLSWLYEESVGMYESLTFIHFSFITPNAILDVVATYEPIVEIIENK